MRWPLAILTTLACLPPPLSADEALASVLNASGFVTALGGVVWSQKDVLPLSSACPPGSFSLTTTQCAPCATCAVEQYEFANCAPEHDVTCAACTPACVAPQKYQFLPCTRLQNRVCYPTVYANLTGVVTFNTTRALQAQPMALALTQALIVKLDTPMVQVSLSSSGNEWTANVSLGFIYNESLTQLLQPSWQWWWVPLLESAAALQPASRRLLAQLIQVIQMQEVTTTVAPCRTGYIQSGGLNCVALPCPAGTGGAFGNCTACAVGTYKNYTADAPCAPCPDATYANTTGRTACDACAGSGRSTLGGTACVCAPGSYGGDESCAACPRGAYSAANASLCTQCPAATYAASEGQSACLACADSTLGGTACVCAPGRYGAGGGDCLPCLVGSYKATAANAGTCDACPPSTYANSTGRTACDACAGNRTVVAGGTACVCGYGFINSAGGCKACPEGSFPNAMSNATTCIVGACPAGRNPPDCALCPPGTAGGGTNCSDCAVGAYASSEGQSTCSLCAGGSFAVDAGQSYCSVCPGGWFANASGLSACQACDRGRFANASGLSACQSCASGSFANATGQTACSACSRGSFANASGLSTCATCDSGHFVSAEGKTTCAACAQGQYALATGQSFCQACASGWFANATGLSSCAACDRGRFASAEGKSSCAACASGWYANETGQSSCRACASGWYASAAQQSYCSICASGSFASTEGKSSCAACASGWYANATGQSFCQACASGWYASAAQQSYCSICASGSFASAEGKSSCAACASGWYANATGQSYCQACASGWFANATGLSLCQACERGAFASAEGKSSCAACASGWYANATGQSYCQACASGWFANATGLSLCQACERGAFASAEGKSACSACAQGQYANATGQSLCRACASGWYANAAGLSLCQACERGSYASAEGKSACGACAQGQYASAAQQSACRLCERGQYASAAQQSACLVCDRGRYANATGQSACVACARGWFAASTGQTGCEACERGQYASAPQLSACAECAGGSYASAAQQSACVACDRGMFANATGQTVCETCLRGSYAPSPGSTACASCPLAAFDGASSCQTCENGDGTYCDANGVSKTCGSGYYCRAASGRLPCIAGHYCPAETTNPIPCPVNTYRESTGAGAAGECSACGARKVTDNVGAISRSECHVCNADSFWDGNACTSCPQDQESNPDADTCSACRPGWYSPPTGGCYQCRPGTYSTSWGSPSCTQCPPSSNGLETYTFTLDANNKPIVVWAANSPAQCLELPVPRVVDGVVVGERYCRAGRFVNDNGLCQECLEGYYCPSITTAAGQADNIRACPNGKLSAAGAMNATLDCSQTTDLSPAGYTGCQVSSGVEALGVDVTALATSKDGKIVFFTSATKLYQLMLDTREASEVATTTTFSGITAVGADQRTPKPQYIVLANGDELVRLDLFTGKTRLLGSKGDVQVAGGISLSGEVAYVSDVAKHRVVGVNFVIAEEKSFLVAGNVNGNAGLVNGNGRAAFFNQPRGLAFYDATTLLVADKGNHAIRKVDLTSNNLVSTLLAPKDAASREIEFPVDVAVRDPANGLFVVQQSGVPLHAKQYGGKWILTALTSMPLMKRIAPTYQAVSDALIYLSSATPAKVGATQTTQLALDYTADGQCHFPCMDGTTCSAPANNCGNYHLDADEKCDTGPGCNSDCTDFVANYTCPETETRCLSPQPAHYYAYEGKWLIEADCAKDTREKPSGYVLNATTCELINIDECVEGTDTCSDYSICKDIPPANLIRGSPVDLGYRCECHQNYYGDGYSCNASSWEVYATYSVPDIPKGSFDTKQAGMPQTYAELIKRAYVDALVIGLEADLPTTSRLYSGPLGIAHANTRIRLLPQAQRGSLFTLSTLFPTRAQAERVQTEAQSKLDTIATLLRNSIGGNHAVEQVQAPLVGPYEAGTFTGPVRQAGWGMNITEVKYNRKCLIRGESVPSGCWEIDMYYQGGTDYSTDTQTQQSLNVLYLPRLEKKVNDPTILADYWQGLTLGDPTSFPCSTSTVIGGKMSPAGTACCLSQFASIYRTSDNFSNFLAEDTYYKEQTTAENCARASIEQSQSPRSDVVFNKLRTDGSTNDMVLGRIQGMEHSDVVLLETVDYSRRIFKVRLLLEEVDLRKHAATVDGDLNSQYTLDFFVGLANFQPTTSLTPGAYTSILQARSMQQRVTVTKSNILTVSTFGANQDPLVGFSSLELRRIKVVNPKSYEPARYADLLVPSFTLPEKYSGPPDDDVVPKGSIRVAKTKGVAYNTDAWQPACVAVFGESATYDNQTLRALYNKAQQQECVNQDLRLCTMPPVASSLVSFGVPLKEGYLTSEDLADGSGEVLTLSFVVTGYNPATAERPQTSLSMSLDLSPLALTRLCETRSGAASLQDIVDGSVVIGTATSPAEWAALQKKRNFDSPGYGWRDKPTETFLFETTTVQGAIMTFAALGDPDYFEDVRAQNYQVNMDDLYTVHFLEPLIVESDVEHPAALKLSPKFDKVKQLLTDGLAFDLFSDGTSGKSWLLPSAALLKECPFTPSFGHLSCIVRRERSVQSGELYASPTAKVVEPPMTATDKHGEENVRELVANVMSDGVATYSTQQTGTAFYNQILQQFNIRANNTRYRKAYMIDPVMRWSTNAIQSAQPGANPFSVMTKILALGLITVTAENGVPQFRRLLSYTGAELQSPTSAVSKTQTPQSQVVSLAKVPGKDGLTLLCQLVLGASLDACKLEQYQVSVPAAQAGALCDADAAGSLSDLIQSELQHKVLPISAGMRAVTLMDYTITGCPPAAGGGRRLLATADQVLVLHKTLSSYDNSTGQVKLYELLNYLGVANPDVWINGLAGGAYVRYFTAEITPGEVTVKVNVTNNVTNNTYKYPPTETIRKLEDSMFTRPSTSSAGRLVVGALNLLSLAALGLVALL